MTQDDNIMHLFKVLLCKGRRAEMSQDESTFHLCSYIFNVLLCQGRKDISET